MENKMEFLEFLDKHIKDITYDMVGILIPGLFFSLIAFISPDYSWLINSLNIGVEKLNFDNAFFKGSTFIIISYVIGLILKGIYEFYFMEKIEVYSENDLIMINKSFDNKMIEIRQEIDHIPFYYELSYPVEKVSLRRTIHNMTNKDLRNKIITLTENIDDLWFRLDKKLIHKYCQRVYQVANRKSRTQNNPKNNNIIDYMKKFEDKRNLHRGLYVTFVINFILHTTKFCFDLINLYKVNNYDMESMISFLKATNISFYNSLGLAIVSLLLSRCIFKKYILEYFRRIKNMILESA